MRWARSLAVCLATATLVSAIVLLAPLPDVYCAPTTSSAPATLGVVFVNGLGSKAPESFEGPVDIAPGNALWDFYLKTKIAGYRTFMVGTEPEASMSAGSLVLDSTGGVHANGQVLANYLRKIKKYYGIMDVVLVGHSMGGVIARQFIEQGYSTSDSAVPRVLKLITIGTPHSGWHPGRVDAVKKQAIMGLLSLPSDEALNDLSSESMAEFNRTAGSNPQVEYVLVGGTFNPDYYGLSGPAIDAFVWSQFWRGLESDGVVFLPSALGHEISTTDWSDAYDGPSIFGPNREVIRVPFYDKYFHSTLDNYMVYGALGVDVDYILTMNDDIYNKVVAPALQKTVAGFVVIPSPTLVPPSAGGGSTAAPATAFVFDVSDSMSEWSATQTKIEEARSAGLDVVDSIGNLAASSGAAAQIAISSFSSTANRVQDLTADYATVRQRIRQLEPLEMTNLGAGLEAGLDQLDAAPGGAAKTIVLLSDGMSNEGMSPDEILAGPVQRAKDSGVKIYTVGFGDPSTTSGYSGLDEDLLNQIANDTGGVYARADTSKARTSLSSLFIHSQVASTQKVLAEFEGTVAQGSLAAAGSFGVAPADSLVQVVLNWPGSQLDLQLTDPAGMAVATGYPGYTLYPGRPAQAVIKNPTAGQWKLAVYGAEVTGTEEPYYALVSSQGAVPGTPIAAGVSGAPSGSATVWLWLNAVPALAVIGWLTWSQRRLSPQLATLEKPAGIEAMAGFANASVTGGQGRLALVAEDGTRFELKHGSNPVGRSSENAIQLDDARASRSHAVIVSEADQVLVRDLGSVGGTLVNGDKVKGERALCDGDRLTFGESTFIFRSTYPGGCRAR
jgi:Mg-chelatase subunit ChlD/pimeloyl-ACP methyl ester carboxylesterase